MLSRVCCMACLWWRRRKKRCIRFLDNCNSLTDTSTTSAPAIADSTSDVTMTSLRENSEDTAGDSPVKGQTPDNRCDSAGNWQWTTRAGYSCTSHVTLSPARWYTTTALRCVVYVSTCVFHSQSVRQETDFHCTVLRVSFTPAEASVYCTVPASCCCCANIFVSWMHNPITLTDRRCIQWSPIITVYAYTVSHKNWQLLSFQITPTNLPQYF